MYDKDYYENGIITGKSLYTNYRWIPELTLSLAHNIIIELDIDKKNTIFDFGCAKGYLVKAFHIFGYDCSGCDISKYAIENCDLEIKNKVYESNKILDVEDKYDFIISKDVLEHVPYENLDLVLNSFHNNCNESIMIIVPLSDNGIVYNCKNYEFDETHIIRESLDWWAKKIEENGFSIEKCSYNTSPIKPLVPLHENANGIFIAKKG